MAFPAPTTPGEQWLYVADTVNILGNNSTINPNPALVDDLLCYVYAQGYTGIFLYHIDAAPFRSTGSSTFNSTNAKAKLANFIAQASAKGIQVGGATGTSPAHLDCLIDYNNNYAAANEKFSAIAIENEWYYYSFNSVIQQPVTGTYSFTAMKSNVLGRKVALHNAGMLSYLYYGWPRDNGYVYPDSSVVSGGDEITQLQGVFDKHMVHSYRTTPEYSYTKSRVRKYTYPVDLLFIVSAEPAFSANYFEGKNSSGSVVYSKKNPINAYQYIVINTDAAGNTPAQVAGSPKYFNAETDANVQNFVNVVGVTVFEDTKIRPLSSGNGPRIWIDAGPNLTNNSYPSTVSVTAETCDDGLPVGSFVTYAWGLQSSPAGSNAYFTAPTSLTTTFGYDLPGTYVLRITATNAGVESYDEMTVYVGTIGATKTLTFNSSTPSTGVPITISVTDLNGDKDGSTSFTRLYDAVTTGLTATAPATASGNSFLKWQRDGVDFSYSTTIQIQDNVDHDFTVIYQSTPPVPRRVQITSNFPGSTFTVNVPDINGDPVGLSGTVLSSLQYYQGQAVQITAPATHPVNGTPFLYFTVNGVTAPAGTTLNLTVGVGDTVTLLYDSFGNGYFTAIPTSQDQYCPGTGGEGRITVVSAGTFTFLWDDGGATTTSVLSSPGVGTYSCVVTETTGLYSPHDSITFTNIPIASPTPITATVGVIDAGCVNPNGSATVNASGGNPPYVYLWNTGGTNNFIVAGAGTYSCRITDQNGCYIDKTGIVIGSGTELVLVDTRIGPIDCLRRPKGSVEVFVSGGVTPYTFTWFKDGSPYTAPNSMQIVDLDPGDYTVLVEDDGSCSATFGPFSITESAPVIVTASTILGSTICSGSEITLHLDSATQDGDPVVRPSILWSTGGTAEDEYIGFLPPGSYSFSVQVTTLSGCVGSATINFNVVASPTDPLVVTLDTAPSACLATEYQLSVTGTSAYDSFIWFPNGETTTTITGPSDDIVSPTDFYVVGYKSSGCSMESNRVTVNPSASTAITSVVVTELSCGGATDNGAIELTVSGGCAPYTYAWTGPVSFTATTKDISGLVAGDYHVIVTDSLSETDERNVTVGISAPVVTAVVTNSGCPGVNSGSVEAAVTGGTPPYTYLWNTGQTTSSITGLAPGTYKITVTDANNCADEGTFFVSGSSPVNVSMRVRNPSAGGNDGEITALPSGGATPYTYLWSTGESTQTIQNLAPGTYTVQVVDNNGCPCLASALLLSDLQEEASILGCCAGDLAYLYVWQMENGLEEKAKCTMLRLKLLNGYLKDMCSYQADTCLTNEQYMALFEKAKYICGCCGCGDDIYDDTILP